MQDIIEHMKQESLNSVGGQIIVTIVSILVLIFVTCKILEPSFSYKGKHVLVTGGSAGIGFELAKSYLSKGANVSIIARNKQKLADAQKSLQTHCKGDQKVLYASVDVSSSLEGISKSLKPLTDDLGDVDVLVNNAGTSSAGTFEETDSSEFQHLFNTNVIGSVNVTKALLAGMKKKDSGRIVFISSQVAMVALHGYSAYAASKWALRGIAEALQMEVKPWNILVSVAYPPDTDTPGYEVEMQSKPELTKKLSESGSVFSAKDVANDIVEGSAKGVYNISTGLDGWMLKQLHPGMSPVNNLWDVFQPILFSPLCRSISIVYVAVWNSICLADRKEQELKQRGDKKSK